MPTNAIDVQGIHKSYFGKAVLKDISLRLESGRFHALIGQNGSGKSTLMRILMRLEAPDRGDGKILGFQLSEDHAGFYRNVAYASEAVNFPSHTGIGQFLSQVGEIYSGWDPALFKKIAHDFNLDLNAKYSVLSRGQRMQAQAALIFAIHPKVMLLDEITAALDAYARSYLIRLCQFFVSSGGTVLMATNIVSEVQPVADTLVYLENTQIRMVSDIQELSKKFLKLRRPRGVDHPVFENPACLELRIGEDDSVLYLIPREAAPPVIPAELIYTGKTNAEDVFVYYTQTSRRKVA